LQGHFQDHLPPVSWRVQILPFLDEEDLYESYHFDELWDGPHNRELIAKMPACFQCALDNQPDGKTPYLAISRPGNPWDNDARHNHPADQTADQTADAGVLLIELSNLRVPWTAPTDWKADSLSVDQKPWVNGHIATDHGAVNIVTGDGHVRSIPASTGPCDLAEILDGKAAAKK
jgi:hypothetical protein